MSTVLPPLPAKRYFTIGEVAQLCGVKPHVLRYWEQEFTQLRPMKRRGNRRYYQHHEVLMIRRIRELLYEQGFTISGARNQLLDGSPAGRTAALQEEGAAAAQALATALSQEAALQLADGALQLDAAEAALLRRELEEIRAILF
ncbi:DNA-binding transcriptional regulator, MerR family [Oryzisolibacter propanilivorax]|uniref:DNA-binding transcriptional regulator, MerR family n=1 Tax=Oryzisolibacter propanilivorax TaxID=1527607 RepID=A0A1G9PLQ2_9BURK|nr:MerR family transcriptional regulator [Oryzisolibacter propanilivorax]SDL99503.1 DNA-binding transcriptional regulator, MerR family [Oryzisolibacter propanilivorax]